MIGKFLEVIQKSQKHFLNICLLIHILYLSHPFLSIEFEKYYQYVRQKKNHLL